METCKRLATCYTTDPKKAKVSRTRNRSFWSTVASVAQHRFEFKDRGTQGKKSKAPTPR